MAATGQQIPGKTTTWVCPAQPGIRGRGAGETEALERRPAEDLGEVGRRDGKAMVLGREAGARTEVVG